MKKTHGIQAKQTGDRSARLWEQRRKTGMCSGSLFQRLGEEGEAPMPSARDWPPIPMSAHLREDPSSPTAFLTEQ